MSDPGGVGTAVQKDLGGLALAAVSGAPECVVEVFLGGRGLGERVLDAVEESERGGLPEVGSCAAFEELPCGVPLAVGDRVGDRCAAGDDGAVGFDVGAGVQERVERVDVVAAGRPVQGRLAVRAGKARVDVGPAATSAATLPAASGKCPGQSVSTCSSVRDCPR